MTTSPQRCTGAAGIRSGCQLLCEAWDQSRDVGEDIWQFAIEMDELRSAGLSVSDLRSLLRGDMLLHGEEFTRLSEGQRRFHPISSLLLTPKSCFVLTEEGYRHATVSEQSDIRLLAGRTRQSASPDCADAPSERATISGHVEGPAERRSDQIPHWDSQLRELRIGDSLIKRFPRPARLQELILCVFEEEGWPPAIDDPLPPQEEQDCKQRLRQTIQNLNRAQQGGRIHFYINGDGQSIRWRIELHHAESPDTQSRTSDG